MEATYEQLDQDEERFRKLQTSDQANFNDRLDTLQVSKVRNKIIPEITGTNLAFLMQLPVGLPKRIILVAQQPTLHMVYSKFSQPNFSGFGLLGPCSVLSLNNQDYRIKRQTQDVGVDLIP